MNNAFFSATYAEAKERFTAAARAVGATVRSYPIVVESNTDLCLDVAVLGPEEAPTLVTSSGVHGVEGFLGSAVQLALLKRIEQQRGDIPARFVFLHAVNPFGFARLRRFNEENVDLNRNFLDDANDHMGAPEGYARLDGLLNPTSPPSRFELFKVKALWNIWRHGLQTLKQSIAGGQYEFPKGLFFGGRELSASAQIIDRHCDEWLGPAQKIAHIDFHSGLGPFAKYKLLLNDYADTENSRWWAAAFGADCVESLDVPDGTAYHSKGDFGGWMRKRFAARQYRFAFAEFGTFDIVRVLAAVRAENRAHYYASRQSPAYRRAKAELLECFCPQDARWRAQVVEAGTRIVGQACDALCRS